jgi:hypothetical protein
MTDDQRATVCTTDLEGTLQNGKSESKEPITGDTDLESDEGDVKARTDRNEQQQQQQRRVKNASASRGAHPAPAPRYSIRELANTLSQTNTDTSELPPELQRRVLDFRLAQQKRHAKYGAQKHWGT